MKLTCLTFVGTILFSLGLLAQAGTQQTSGIFQSSTDYQNGRPEFEGNCRSKLYKLEVHDVSNKPYLDLTQGTQKRRLFKAKVFGFRSCGGYDYRFDANLAYRVLEAKEAYVYVRQTHFSRYQSGRDWTYYFSAGPGGQLLTLTVTNLKQAYPQNQVFRDSLDSIPAAHQKLEQYDKVHEMFEVNSLLQASHAPQQ